MIYDAYYFYYHVYVTGQNQIQVKFFNQVNSIFFLSPTPIVLIHK